MDKSCRSFRMPAILFFPNRMRTDLVRSSDAERHAVAEVRRNLPLQVTDKISSIAGTVRNADRRDASRVIKDANAESHGHMEWIAAQCRATMEKARKQPDLPETVLKQVEEKLDALMHDNLLQLRDLFGVKGEDGKYAEGSILSRTSEILPPQVDAMSFRNDTLSRLPNAKKRMDLGLEISGSKDKKPGKIPAFNIAEYDIKDEEILDKDSAAHKFLCALGQNHWQNFLLDVYANQRLRLKKNETNGEMQFEDVDGERRRALIANAMATGLNRRLPQWKEIEAQHKDAFITAVNTVDTMLRGMLEGTIADKYHLTAGSYAQVATLPDSVIVAPKEGWSVEEAVKQLATWSKSRSATKPGMVEKHGMRVGNFGPERDGNNFTGSVVLWMNGGSIHEIAIAEHESPEQKIHQEIATLAKKKGVEVSDFKVIGIEPFDGEEVKRAISILGENESITVKGRTHIGESITATRNSNGFLSTTLPSSERGNHDEDAYHTKFFVSPLSEGRALGMDFDTVENV